jgi:hypothetical protein
MMAGEHTNPKDLLDHISNPRSKLIHHEPRKARYDSDKSDKPCRDGECSHTRIATPGSLSESWKKLGSYRSAAG